MKIVIDAVEVFSKKYQTFDAINEEYINYCDDQEQRVPDYDLNVLLDMMANFFISSAASVFVEEVRKRIRDREKESSQVQDDHQSANSDLMTTLLSWARDNEVSIEITIETMAESDLEEAFEEKSQQLSINIKH
jgi:hypothetical protein